MGHAPTFMALLTRCPDIADLGSIGTKNDKTANQASSAMTTTAIAEAGRLVVLMIACDNNQTTDGDEAAVSTIADSAGGNTWSKLKAFTNGQGTAQTGACIDLWYSVLTNAIASGGTITPSFSNSTVRDATAMSARKFVVAPGKTVSVEGTAATLANDGADPGSMNVTTTGVGEVLRLRAIAQETNQSSITPTTGWTSFGSNNTTGAQAATNMAVLGEFKISTETGSASDPTSTSADTASVYGCLKAA